VRSIPYQITDAVELWAREHGRHGSVRRDPRGFAVIELSIKDDDPRMKGWREGKLKSKPVDKVPLLYQKTFRDQYGKEQRSPRYSPIDLEELGVSGVLEILNRGNLASGTGEWRDLMQCVQSVAAKNDALKDSIMRAARDNARARAREIVRDAAPKSFVAANISA
jgi:hypothetical protein